MAQLIHNEAFWTAIGSITVWLIQMYSTPLAADLSQDRLWKRVLRRAHGVLNKIDPEGNVKS